MLIVNSARTGGVFEIKAARRTIFTCHNYGAFIPKTGVDVKTASGIQIERAAVAYASACISIKYPPICKGSVGFIGKGALHVNFAGPSVGEAAFVFEGIAGEYGCVVKGAYIYNCLDTIKRKYTMIFHRSAGIVCERTRAYVADPTDVLCKADRFLVDKFAVICKARLYCHTAHIGNCPMVDDFLCAGENPVDSENPLFGGPSVCLHAGGSGLAAHLKPAVYIQRLSLGDRELAFNVKSINTGACSGCVGVQLHRHLGMDGVDKQLLDFLLVRLLGPVRRHNLNCNFGRSPLGIEGGVRRKYMSGQVHLCADGCAGVPAGEHIAVPDRVRRDIVWGQHVLVPCLGRPPANTVVGIKGDGIDLNRPLGV